MHINKKRRLAKSYLIARLITININYKKYPDTNLRRFFIKDPEKLLKVITGNLIKILQDQRHWHWTQSLTPKSHSQGHRFAKPYQTITNQYLLTWHFRKMFLQFQPCLHRFHILLETLRRPIVSFINLNFIFGRWMKKFHFFGRHVVVVVYVSNSKCDGRKKTLQSKHE